MTSGRTAPCTPQPVRVVANMVTGHAASPRSRDRGVGYRAAAARARLTRVGPRFSHPVVVDAPDGVTFDVPTPTRIIVKGIDKEKVGQVGGRHPQAAEAPSLQRQGSVFGERVMRKAGKAAK